MKKVVFVVIFNIFIVIFASASIAMPCDIKDNKELITQKVRCQEICSTINNCLNEWEEDRKVILNFPEFLDPINEAQIRECLTRASRMDFLFSEILRQKSALDEVLSTLKNSYKNIKEEEMLTFLEIKDQYKLITDEIESLQKVKKKKA